MELFAAVQPLVLTHDGYRMVYGEDDPEELALLQMQDRELASRIDGALRDLFFLETHFSQPRDDEGLAEEVGTVEDLHELRRIAAALHGLTPQDYQEGNVAPGFPFNHLINHADTDGYYLPVEFPQAFFLEEVSIGSAAALLQELEALHEPLAQRFQRDVARALATPDDQPRAPITGPAGVWHSLQRLCRSAMALNLPLHLG